MTELQRTRGHPGLVGARLGGHLAPDHVADGPVARADGGVPGEGVGLGQEPGVEDLAGGRDERLDGGEGDAAGNLSSGHVRGAADHEGRGAVQGLGKVAHHRGLARGRVDHLDVVGGGRRPGR